MKALVRDVYGPPDVLQLREIERPEIGDHEVLVRIRAAGVDRGVWHLLTGLPYLVRLAGYGLRKPKSRVPGMDMSGHVEAVGGKVTRFRPGDEVFGMCDGSYAEYARAREDQLALKPATLTFEQAGALPVSALAALQGLRDAAGLRAGQSVLITGAAGGVGTFGVQIAKACGAEVTGVCSAAKAPLVRSLGADRVIDYAKEDFTRSRRRYDVILDIAGNRPLSRLRRALAPHGTLVIVGGEDGGRWIGGTDRQLRAMALSPLIRQRLRGFVSKNRSEDLRELAELSDAGKISPVVGRVYPLVQGPAAIRDLLAGLVPGKAVITI